MAELAPTSTLNLSMGSNKLAVVGITLLSATGDTYTIEIGAPVVDYWMRSNVGSAGYAPDVKFDATAGTFTFYAARTGAQKLFILLKS
jgi:hypothetical protein